MSSIKYNNYLINTYSPRLCIKSGKGSYVFDTDNKKYLDLTSGIAVCNFGHCNDFIRDRVIAQSEKLWHISNLFMTESQLSLAKKISDLTFKSKLFFCNSGTEANEGLIKFARSYGSKTNRHEIICMKNSFHGRTLASLAATGRTKYQENFAPLPTGFAHASYNDIESVKQLINSKTVAILVESVLGEGGVIPAKREFLQQLRTLCDEYDLLLMFDEVQTGVGRTGNLFGHLTYDIDVDALSMAKALGNGFPIGAFQIKEKHADVLQVSSHASTFGGNPLACSAANAVLDLWQESSIQENLQNNIQLFKNFLAEIKEEFVSITDIKQVGLMIGIDIPDKVQEVISLAETKGLLVLSAGSCTLRLLPMITTTSDELYEAFEILKNTFKELKL